MKFKISIRATNAKVAIKREKGERKKLGPNSQIGILKQAHGKAIEIFRALVINKKVERKKRGWGRGEGAVKVPGHMPGSEKRQRKRAKNVSSQAPSYKRMFTRAARDHADDSLANFVSSHCA